MLKRVISPSVADGEETVPELGPLTVDPVAAREDGRDAGWGARRAKVSLPPLTRDIFIACSGKPRERL